MCMSKLPGEQIFIENSNWQNWMLNHSRSRTVFWYLIFFCRHTQKMVSIFRFFECIDWIPDEKSLGRRIRVHDIAFMCLCVWHTRFCGWHCSIHNFRVTNKFYRHSGQRPGERPLECRNKRIYVHCTPICSHWNFCNWYICFAQRTQKHAK